jgi:hypothetical protein
MDIAPPSAMTSTRLDALFARCEGAYADRTLRSYRADLDLFVAWCEGRAAGWLPAEPADVATFLDGEAARHRFSTVRRRLSAIGFAHRLADLPDPSRHSEVRLALRRAMRRKARRTAQMVGLTHGLRDRILAACPDDLAGRRDAALIAVGYDTLCRSWELASMRVADLEVDGDGVVSVLIPRSKADIAGDCQCSSKSPQKCSRRFLSLRFRGVAAQPWIWRSGGAGAWTTRRVVHISTAATTAGVVFEVEGGRGTADDGPRSISEGSWAVGRGDGVAAWSLPPARGRAADRRAGGAGSWPPRCGRRRHDAAGGRAARRRPRDRRRPRPIDRQQTIDPIPKEPRAASARRPPKLRLEVRIMAPRSYRALTSWKNRLPPPWTTGR